ncbi:hypothetical protein [Alteribacillus sp. HJP-4]|uniref:hypothetical protein n=1 Tax=Alteribacillus sp. HJP-4 TaxID=2775394 RepID=UPI0035CCDA7C
MMARLCVIAIGFGLAAGGGMSLIAYLNYIPAGWSAADYLLFIVKRPESAVLLIGIVFVSAAIYWPEYYNHKEE